MRGPAKIKRWLSTEKMAEWVESAEDGASLTRRRAVWLTHSKRLYAEEVAAILGVSVQAVWLWVGQYNAEGPKGLERKGRGGRRWGFMSRCEESELLKPFIRQAKLPRPAIVYSARISTAQELHTAIGASPSYPGRVLRGSSRMEPATITWEPME